MQINKLSTYTRGWYIGSFEPAVYKTRDFEVGYLSHKKGEICLSHYHEQTLEINLLVKGVIKFGDIILQPGDIFTFQKFEISKAEFIEDCEIVCIKTPSLPFDKINVYNPH